MNDAIIWLAAAVLATALMWVPYILNSFVVRGVMVTMGYDDNVPPLSPWAARAKRAHFNAIENLAIFAPVVLAHAVVGTRDPAVATVAAIYLVSRVVHYLVYVAKIPILRTLAFFGGWGSTLYLAITVL